MTPTPLALYGHPFSSYTQKVLIALHENGTAFELRNLDPAAPGNHAAEWKRRWPLAQFPVLVDGDRTVAESSIVIEHLQLAHPGRVPLIPADPAAALEVRFMDRFFDLHVMSPVQHAVGAALTGDAARRTRPGPSQQTNSTAPTPGWTPGGRAAPGPRAMPSPWPIAQRHPPCSTATGRTPLPPPTRRCVRTACACWPARRWPGRWMAGARTATTFRWAPPTATDCRTGLSRRIASHHTTTAGDRPW